jgi:hypothetical protein
LIESFVINVTATLSPSGTGARLDPTEPVAAPVATPLALLVAALAAAAEVVVLALLPLLPHADSTSAAAVAASNKGTNRPVRDFFPPYRMCNSFVEG